MQGVNGVVKVSMTGSMGWRWHLRGIRYKGLRKVMKTMHRCIGEASDTDKLRSERFPFLLGPLERNPTVCGGEGIRFAKCRSSR